MRTAIVAALLLAWAAAGAAAVSAESAAPGARVTGGEIQGLATAADGAVFKGIPFAQPPSRPGEPAAGEGRDHPTRK